MATYSIIQRSKPKIIIKAFYQTYAMMASWQVNQDLKNQENHSQ